MQRVVVGDSRINNFDCYQQPKDFNIIYVIQRGAKVNQLKDKTLQTLQAVGIGKDCQVEIKLCAGINEFLSREHHEGGIETKLSDINVHDIVHKFISFKTDVKSIYLNAQVSFATVPHMSFEKYRMHCIKNKTLSKPKYSTEENQAFQKSLNTKVNEVNKLLIAENTKNSAKTVFLHSDICKSHTKRKGRNKRKVSQLSYHFGRLYDGLHACSETKRKWFEKIIASFTSTKPSTSTVLNSTSDSSSDESDRHWKRQKCRK